ncbi:type I-E CRISPR-associated protein Cse2/CasB [Microbacterium sp. BWT-B31]|uniref:type I-E CRISPR-associated protein Cse2/CasB n=1 Tax=Microbacterium sp. BWT-B31 TaxID=3232072 RepID=UPI0035284128
MTMAAEPEAADRKSLGERLAIHVASRAERLQSGYLNDHPAAVAELAMLRRGASQQPGEDVRLVGLTMAGLYPNPNGLDNRPLDAERAAYAALTLFAIHQQSHRDARMHRKGYSFGRSARLLGRRSGARDAVRARFTALATATTWDETMNHARGLIQQLRAHGIPLDYGQFGRDLLDLRGTSGADGVRLAWGRHFYREHNPEDDGDDADASTTEH